MKRGMIILIVISVACKQKKIEENLDIASKNVQAKIDSVLFQASERKQFLDSLESEIESAANWQTAYFLDSLIKINPSENRLYLLKGLFFHEKKMYDSALAQYSKAMAVLEYPSALDKRAKTYLAMNQLDAAIEDYRKAFLINKDYSKQLAECYSFKGNKDSTRKYTEIYQSQQKPR